jgi:palmitoyltransferase ZDHHC9/14/18
LLLLNITTIEQVRLFSLFSSLIGTDACLFYQIRNQAHKTLVPGPAPPNPFSHGTWRRNLLQVLCRPVGFSALDAHGLATQDEREVNPGLGHKEQGGKERRIDG